MFRQIAVVTSLALALAGCSQDAGSYDQYVADYEQELLEMQQANDAHEAAVSSADNLSAVTAEEDDHYAQMQTMMEEMMGTSETMEQCDMMDSMDMTGMTDSMEQEMEEHHDAMTNAASMEDAMLEETEHQSTMDEMFGSMEYMDSQMSGMMGTEMGC